MRVELGTLGTIVVEQKGGNVLLDLPGMIFRESGLIRPADAETIGEAFLRAAERAREYASMGSASL